MKEINEIVTAFLHAVQGKKRTALATIVHVEGSSYRRPGARMLITEDGQLTGAISGGCLEGDALRKAQYVIMKNESMLVTYDTMDEDDAKFGIGLGCNGIIHVLIEPIDPEKNHHPIRLLQSIVSKRQRATLVTLFSLTQKQHQQPGTCLLINEDGSQLGKLPLLSDAIQKDAGEVFSRSASVFRNYISSEIDITAFIEHVQPPVSLVIIGGGNDVIPLVKMAGILGWDTTVIDGRPQYASNERFAAACQVFQAKPEEILNRIMIDNRTVFLLMTHNYNYDLAVLQQLLSKDIVYTGILGPRKKFERMLTDLRELGITLTTQQLERVYSPIGISIGAESAEEIALSILAEIQQVLSGKSGKPLRGGAYIHSRTETVITTVQLQSK